MMTNTAGDLITSGRAAMFPGPRPESALDIEVALQDIARELDLRWTHAVEGGDFDEIARLVDASHAVHRAALALHPDTLVPGVHAGPQTTQPGLNRSDR